MSLELGTGSSTIMPRTVFRSPSMTIIQSTTGWGFDAGGRLALGFVSLGAGYRRVDFSERDLAGSAKWTMRGVVVSPRITVPAIRHLSPFVQLDVGQFAETTDGSSPFGPLRLDNRVRTVGERAGVDFEISRAFSLDAAVAYSVLSYGGYTIDGVPFDVTKASEHSVDARLGASYRIW
jgi:hypothetical protein